MFRTSALAEVPLTIRSTAPCAPEGGGPVPCAKLLLFWIPTHASESRRRTTWRRVAIPGVLRWRVPWIGVLLVAAVATALVVHAMRDARTHAVVLLAGQSNMAGLASAAGLPACDDGVEIYLGTSARCGETPRTRALQAGGGSCQPWR